jgi:hypothetical protein
MTSTTTISNRRFEARLEPVHAVEREAHRLQDLERAGESDWTPWVALAGLVVFFASAVALLTALTFAAYSLG